MKFLHTADLHLGAPFKSINASDAETGRKLRDATLTAYEGIVQLAIDEDVDFVLFAGDIFNAEHDMQHAQVQFRKGIRRLHDFGIQSFVICGNHDPLVRNQKRLELPSSCTLFSTDSVTAVPVIKNGQVLAQVLGISYPDARVTERLVARFPSASGNEFTIGMLHGNLANSVGHENYAPFTLAELAQPGYDYWALGHIHIHQEFRAGKAVAVFPGSPQGLDPTETGPHGCVIGEQHSNGDFSTTFYPTCAVQWENVEIACGTGQAWETQEDLEQLLDDCLTGFVEQATNYGRSFALRIKLSGRTPLYHTFATAGSRSALHSEYHRRNAGEFFVWVEQFDWNLRPDIDMDELLKQPSFQAEVAKECNTALGDPARLTSYFAPDAAGLVWRNPVLDRLLAHFKQPEYQKYLMERARDLALDRLMEEDN